MSDDELEYIKGMLRLLPSKSTRDKTTKHFRQWWNITDITFKYVAWCITLGFIMFGWKTGHRWELFILISALAVLLTWPSVIPFMAIVFHLREVLERREHSLWEWGMLIVALVIGIFLFNAGWQLVTATISALVAIQGSAHGV